MLTSVLDFTSNKNRAKAFSNITNEKMGIHRCMYLVN